MISMVGATVDLTIFDGRQDPHHLVNEALANLDSHVQGDNLSPPPIFYLFMYLNHLGLTELLDVTLEKLDSLLSFRADLKVWVDFIDLYKKATVVLPPDLKQTLEECMEDQTYDHPFLQEGIQALQVIYHQRTGGLDPIDTVLAEMDSPLWLILTLSSFADVSWRAGNWSLAEMYLAKMEDLVGQYPLKIFQVNICNMRGNILLNQGQVDQAVQFHLQALDLAKTTHNQRSLQSITNNLGVDYFSLGQYLTSEQYLASASKMQESPQQRANSLNNLAFAQFSRGDLSKSYEAYKEAETTLAEIKNPNIITGGFVRLGFGLHRAARGEVEEALPLFNEALAIFVNHNNIHAQIYLHGMVGALFYDSQDFDLAEIYFQQFLEKLDQTRSYQTYYHYYCLYYLSLLDQRRYEEAEAHLALLSIIGARNKNNQVIKAWLKYVLGLKSLDNYRFPVAESLLQQVVHLTQVHGPFALTMRSAISLSELYLQRYLLSGDETLLQQVEGLLNLADSVGTENQIFPSVSYIKLYKAMIYAHRNEWGEVEKNVSEAQQFIDRSGHSHLKSRFQSMVEQINSQRLLAGDFARGLVNALRYGSGRQKVGRKVTSSEVGLVLWKFSTTGPRPCAQLIPPGFVSHKIMDNSLTSLGTLFVTILGQGDQYHEGLFGPLPVPLPDENLTAMVSSKIVDDSSQRDRRLLAKNYCVLAVLLHDKAFVDQSALKTQLTEWWHNIGDISSFRRRYLEELVPQLLTAVRSW